MATCLVVLGLFAYIKTKNGNCKTIPIDPNYFVNSPLGIKPIRFKIGDETTQTNIDESDRVEEQMKIAEDNPYSHKTKSGIMLKIYYKSYLTMVKPEIAPLIACTIYLYNQTV